MKLKREMISEYHIGILWNKGYIYAKEIIKRINTMNDIVQVRILDLADQYAKFVLDCYEGDSEAFNDGYIYDKIKTMNINNKKVITFILKIDNPTYKANKGGNIQCVETRRIKQKIREEYASKIEGYFFDNLIHISDNINEMLKTLQVINRYEAYTIKEYVKEGYTKILDSPNKKNSTDINLLNELENER